MGHVGIGVPVYKAPGASTPGDPNRHLTDFVDTWTSGAESTTFLGLMASYNRLTAGDSGVNNKCYIQLGRRDFLEPVLMSDTKETKKRIVNRTIKRVDAASVLKPKGASTFEPTYTVEEVYGVNKQGADYIYARLKPHGGGANEMGLVTLRMPAMLSESGSLGAFARAVGQDVRKRFDPERAVGKQVRFLLVPVGDGEPTEE